MTERREKQYCPGTLRRGKHHKKGDGERKVGTNKSAGFGRFKVRTFARKKGAEIEKYEEAKALQEKGKESGCFGGKWLPHENTAWACRGLGGGGLRVSWTSVGVTGGEKMLLIETSWEENKC